MAATTSVELADSFSVTTPAEIENLTAAVHDSLSRFAAEGLLADRPIPGRFTMTLDPALADDGTETPSGPSRSLRCSQ